MTTRGYCSKQICDSTIYYPPANNISKKMLQAKAIRLNGRKSISYDNSLSFNYTHTILDADFDKNKNLLLYIRYKTYIRYFNSCIKCGDNGNKAMILYQMLENIISSLTTKEYNYVFEIQEVIDVSNEVLTDFVMEFYVVTRDAYNYNYFIIKNITSNYFFIPNKSYSFDLSDPSNLNTKFCLSENKDGIAVSGLTYIGTPGTEGAKLNITIPSNLTSNHLYIFNSNITYDNGNLFIDGAYGKWGYNIEYINVLLVPLTIINSGSLSNNTFVCINKNSNLAVYEYKGPKFYINDNINSQIIRSLDYNRYVVSYGTYYLYVPKIYTATLLNYGLEKAISFVGNESTKTTEFVKGLNLCTNPIDAEYNFYYDTVLLTVYKSFSPLTFYSKKYGYMNSIGMLYFSESCDEFSGPSNLEYAIDYAEDSTYYGIRTQTKLTINYGNNNTQFISFNDIITSNVKYGMYIGEYYIFNIPQNYPITFLNRNKENLVNLHSVNGTYIMGLGPDGYMYKFYYGTLLVTIYGNFGYMSLYSNFSGYMGGYKIIKYDSKFNNNQYYPDQRSVPTITEITGDNTFNDIIVEPIYFNLNITSYDVTIPFSSLYVNFSIMYNDVTIVNNNIIINNYTPYNNQIKYRMNTGIYVIRSTGNYLAILNTGKTSLIQYFGGLSIISNGADGNSYQFYKDFIAIYVYNNFGYVTLDINGKATGNFILAYNSS